MGQKKQTAKNTYSGVREPFVSLWFFLRLEIARSQRNAFASGFVAQLPSPRPQRPQETCANGAPRVQQCSNLHIRKCAVVRGFNSERSDHSVATKDGQSQCLLQTCGFAFRPALARRVHAKIADIDRLPPLGSETS